MTALIAVSGIGRKTLFKIKAVLTERELSWLDFWQQKEPHLWKKAGLNCRQQHNLKKWQQTHRPETYFGRLRQQKIQVVTIDDKKYPILLKKIDDPPILIYIKGSLLGLKQPLLSIVGTRQISGYGRQVCHRLIPNLVARNITIVSGFMYGVDITAQKLAHQQGGRTVGVLGFGFDQMYPRRHQAIFDKFLAQGQTFITEYPPHIQPQAALFPERNRIVAGLSAATLVIEAGQKSGSHITARLAIENGRSVCAVPGPITNPYSEGTKWLINQGARLVTSAKEVIEEAGFETGGWSQPFIADDRQIKADDLTEQGPIPNQIYQELQLNPSSADELSRFLSLPIATINAQLSLLELEGLITRSGQTWYVH